MLLHKRISPLTSSPQTAKPEPAKNPKLPGVRRWSSLVMPTRSWRIGTISLRSNNHPKSLSSRQVERPATKRPSGSDKIQRIDSQIKAVNQPLEQRVAKDFCANLKGMLSGITRTTVDKSGICSALEKDVLRGTEITDSQTFSKGIQAQIAAATNPGKTRETAASEQLHQFGTSNFLGNTALMEAFTKVANQNAFVPLQVKLGSVMGLCDYETPTAQAPMVLLGKPTQTFHLANVSIESKKASMRIEMSLKTPIAGVSFSEQTLSQHMDPEQSHYSFSASVEIEVDLDQVGDPAQKEVEDRRDAKYQAEAPSAPIGSEEESWYHSRLEKAVTVNVKQSLISYQLVPAKPSSSQ